MCCLWVKKAKINHVILMSSCSGFLCMFYANKCILCRAHIFLNLHLVIPIDQVVFLLFIVDCNDSDNHIKQQQHFVSFLLTGRVCFVMTSTDFLKPIHRRFATGYFCECFKRHFWWSRSESVTLTCAFPFSDTFSVWLISHLESHFNRTGEMRACQFTLNLSNIASAQP